jgi:prevent-host-death family protein
VRTISVREARQNFRRLLDAVEAGEEVAVVRRGRQIARMVPARRPLGPLPDLRALRRTIRVDGRPLSEEVVRMRQEGRY